MKISCLNPYTENIIANKVKNTCIVLGQSVKAGALQNQCRVLPFYIQNVSVLSFLLKLVFSEAASQCAVYLCELCTSAVNWPNIYLC